MMDRFIDQVSSGRFSASFPSIKNLSLVCAAAVILQLVTITTSSIVPLTGQHHRPPQSHQGPVRWPKPTQSTRKGRPVDVMTDVINDLGVKILDKYVENSGNVAFSPSGLGFVLAALYEGSAGSSSREISNVLGLPRDRRITRIGLRDIHRRLRSYLNADAFLGGLTLNREDINLRPDYEEILRFYGFDISDSGMDDNSTDPIMGNATDSNSTTTNGPNSDSSDTTAVQTATTLPINAAVDVVANSTDGPSSSMSMGPSNISTISNIPPTLTMMSLVSSVTNLRNSTNTTTMTTTTTTTTTTTMTPMSSQSTSNGVISTTPATTTLASVQTVTNGTNSTTTPMQRLVGIPILPTNTQTQSSSNPAATMPTNAPLTTATAGSSQPTVISTVDSITTTNDPMQNQNFTTDPVMSNSTSSMADSSTNTVRKRRGILHGPGGYFPGSSDEGIWLDEFGRYNTPDDYPSQEDDVGADPKRPTEIAFLVNGCDYSRVTGAAYTALLPFCYFPSLRASLLEFPLDDPRYKILVILPSDENGTKRLARMLTMKPITLRRLRRSLHSTWITAVVPSFMLRGFVTLTPYLQRLGISDVFDPRAADLTPMSPDLGVYARDIQQSIGVNIRNNAKGGIGGADGGDDDDAQNDQPQQSQRQRRDDLLIRRIRGVPIAPFFVAGGSISPRLRATYPSYPATPLYDKAPPVPFVVDRPFLYFIVDDETSVTLLAGRIDDPLNSRML